jgi:hypothetical protein
MKGVRLLRLEVFRLQLELYLKGHEMNKNYFACDHATSGLAHAFSRTSQFPA